MSIFYAKLVVSEELIPIAVKKAKLYTILAVLSAIGLKSVA